MIERTTLDEARVADAAPSNWVDRYAPRPLRPYARLARWDRPIGVMLLLWPCWWAVVLAALASNANFPDLRHMALFAVGAFAMRGAGCTYNDLVDRDLDAQVARTRLRPIASGQITLAGAVAFLLLQALVGLAVLVQFNSFTVYLALGSLVVVAIYPFMKRITSWPQVALGLAFSWGALVGWSATFGSLSWPTIWLYGAAFFWIMAYDTVYALQDKEDDALIGIGSTALLFGDTAKAWISAFYGVGLILLIAAGLAAGAALIFCLVTALGALYMGWNLRTMNAQDPKAALREFKRNDHLGWIVFFGLVLDLWI